MQKNIYDLTMTNGEESPELSLEGGFEFGRAGLSCEDILKLHKKVIKFEGGFVHFERIYNMNNGCMVRLSMGSFDKPEHAYVLIRNSAASYYRSAPLRSKSNIEAHQILDKVLHG